LFHLKRKKEEALKLAASKLPVGTKFVTRKII